MPELTPQRCDIKRRSTSHSAYWVTNMLIPIGLIIILKHGWGIEAILGAIIIATGVRGLFIYKQKMDVPLISYDAQYLLYSASQSNSGSIKLDSNARFTVHELGLTAESIDGSGKKIEISFFDFNSNDDWQTFIEHLKREPEITLLFEH